MMKAAKEKAVRGLVGRLQKGALLICLLALLGQAAYALASPPGEATAPPPFDGWPALTSDGFLEIAPGGETEFVFVDEASGVYAYCSADLRVEIRRFEIASKRNPLVWYLSDIRFSKDQAFRAILSNPRSPKSQDRPENIAKQHQVVYAQNGDLFSFRMYNKERVGLIIRDGKIIKQDTYTRPVAKIPPLDELALYPDGRVEMRTPGQLSAQDYLDLGARDVLAFGPILFQNRVKDDRLDRSFTHKEPRSALGVVAPGHFVGILVEGRNQRSVGANLQFVADRLLEAGCVEAFTLDGGQTAAMIFMGRNVMSPGIYNGFQKARKQQDILAIGTSKKVPYPAK